MRMFESVLSCDSSKRVYINPREVVAIVDSSQYPGGSRIHLSNGVAFEVTRSLDDVKQAIL